MRGGTDVESREKRVQTAYAPQGTKKVKAEGNPHGRAYHWPEGVPAPPNAKDGRASIGEEDNYKESASIPYSHEAHHVVADAELRTVIADVGKGHPKHAEITALTREALLGEDYNLSHKDNMIILPMNRMQARVIKLPVHRRTPLHFHHQRYSAFIKSELTDYFAPIREQAEKHDSLPEYKPVKKKIEGLSTRTYPKIFSAGRKMWGGTMAGDSLEDIPHTHLRGRTRTSAKAGPPP